MKFIKVMGMFSIVFAMFGLFMVVVSSYASFAIVDANGKQQFTMPFTTQSTADAAALKDCGQGCKAVRIVRQR